MKSKGLKDTSKEEIQANAKGEDFKKDDSNKAKSDKFKGRRKFKHGKRVNDPNWYVANPQIVKDVANLPFAVYNGMSYSLFKYQSAFNFLTDTKVITDTNVPGIMIYKYLPWYGNSTPTSSLNLTMRALYSFVRHVNSGKTNYEAPDLMLYIMAMDSVYLLIHEIKRFIRLAYHYNLENRGIPEKIFNSLGVDHLDLVQNLANYRAQLNTRIAKANSLAVPNNFNIFKRRAVFGSVVLTDEPNRPTQLIIPKADGVYKFNAKGISGGQLDWVSLTKTGTYKRDQVSMTLTQQVTYVKDYLDILDDLLSVLLSDEDINVMSGDLIKAYGDNLYKLPFIEENEIQEITHDENLLLQFSNSTVLDIEGATLSNVTTRKYSRLGFAFYNSGIQYAMVPIIGQFGGSLLAQAVFNNSAGRQSNDYWSVLNPAPLATLSNVFISTSSSSSISPENILEWTRLCMVMENIRNDRPGYTIEAGVEIGLGWLVYTPTNYFQTYSSSLYPMIVSQYFQFGNVDTPGFARPFPSSNPTRSSEPAAHAEELPTDESAEESHIDQSNKSRAAQDPILTNGSYMTYWLTDSTNNSERLTANETYRNRNSWYVKQAMSGLTYGPNNYLVGGMNYKSETNVVLWLDGSIEKLYEKTAIATKENIIAMHDAALLGLISSPYVKNS